MSSLPNWQLPVHVYLYTMQKITPFLWFDRGAEDAATFYTSVFPNSEITSISRYGAGSPLPEGTALVVDFVLDGQQFHALNGGPYHTFNESVSFYIKSDTQEEIDHYWETLSEGGARQQCGWLKDRFGLSWQVAPPILGRLLQDKDRVAAGRVMQAMMKMTKIDIAGLQRAFDGEL
jgi:predicted 3-demethylubiquinone-9 3-methyltransferase (glyoxalase superfamily)